MRMSEKCNNRHNNNTSDNPLIARRTNRAKNQLTQRHFMTVWNVFFKPDSEHSKNVNCQNWTSIQLGHMLWIFPFQPFPDQSWDDSIEEETSEKDSEPQKSQRGSLEDKHKQGQASLLMLTCITPEIITHTIISSGYYLVQIKTTGLGKVVVLWKNGICYLL